ncbi:MAG TPA: phage protein GemA/Gp16 family protein, partial [Candidatus Binataceae bacterium]|nr:phage protein GemA/Gp16 family protein [Candidatus Binataceae bacterium]
LWRDYAGADDERGLNAWLKRTCKVDALRFLDRDAAIKAIEGLRAMTRRKKRDTGGETAAEGPDRDPAA